MTLDELRAKTMCGIDGIDRVPLADAEAALAECEQENHYQKSYIKQADDTLALILQGYKVEHIHDQCGVICKINALEELLAALTEAGEGKKQDAD